MDQLLKNMNNKTKFRFIKNNPFAYVRHESRDKVLGFIIGNPGIMTRKYTQFIHTEFFNTYKYC